MVQGFLTRRSSTTTGHLQSYLKASHLRLGVTLIPLQDEPNMHCKLEVGPRSKASSCRSQDSCCKTPFHQGGKKYHFVTDWTCRFLPRPSRAQVASPPGVVKDRNSGPHMANLQKLVVVLWQLIHIFFKSSLEAV